jgi:hypothetical protein
LQLPLRLQAARATRPVLRATLMAALVILVSSFYRRLDLLNSAAIKAIAGLADFDAWPHASSELFMECSGRALARAQPPEQNEPEQQ